MRTMPSIVLTLPESGKIKRYRRVHLRAAEVGRLQKRQRRYGRLSANERAHHWYLQQRSELEAAA